ncbi:MAG: hypothetical protein HRU70_13080 [Phycisphaeraceae bacterium]|nr:MAG: hypothetical protein HRU70_13080 [Phycisphaeraceae bacterium]
MAERFLRDIMRVEITDDAGSARTVPFLDLWGPPRGFPNHPGRADLWRIRRTVAKRTWFMGTLVGASTTTVVSLMFIAGVLIQAPAFPAPGSSGWPGAAVARSTLISVAVITPIVVILYEAVALRLFRRAYRPAFRDASLERGLCPFCLYRMVDVSSGPAATARVTCPECGGSWDLGAGVSR